MKYIKFSPMQGNNVGDVVISKCITHILRELEVDVKSFDLFLRDVDSYSSKQEKSHKQLRLRNKVSFFLQCKYPYIFYNIKKVIFHFGKTKKEYKKLLDNTDVVLIGGGNLLMSKMGCDYAYIVNEILKLSKSKKKLIISCGAGPFDFDERKLVSELHRNSDHVTVRDDVSKSYFSKYNYNVDIIPDPVFMLADLLENKFVETKRNKVGINLISNFFTNKQLQTLAIEIVDMAIIQKLDLVIVNTAFPQDKEVAVEFYNYVKQYNDSIYIEIVDIDSSPDSIADVYQHFSFFIGCRMHSIIFSLSLGVPAVGFSWDEKVVGMFQQFFNRDNVNEYILDIEKLDFSKHLNLINETDFKSNLLNVKQRVKKGFSNAIKGISND